MRTSEFRWSQVRVGLFVALTGIILFAAVVYVGLAGTPFARRAELKAYFDDVSGLAVGSPVEMGGVVVGEVTGIDLPELETGKVPMHVAVEHRALERLGPSTVAFNASHALVGQRYVGLTPKKPGEPSLEPGATLKTRTSPELDVLVDQVSQTLAEIRGLAEDARKLSQALARASTSIDSKEGTLGRFLHDPALYEEFLAVAKSAREVTDAASGGDGTLATLLKDPKLAAEVRGGLASLSSTARRVEQGQGILGRLTTEGDATKNIDRTLANLSTVSTRLTEAQGTLGQLINDPALLGRMNELLGEMDRLVADVRRNPRRYLNVEAF